MNERIQELAEQAGYTEAYYASDYGPFIPAEFNKQKFAELIVKECAKIAGKAEYSDTWLEPVEDAIKKHFGVKE